MLEELRDKLESLTKKVALKEAEILDLRNELHTLRALLNAAIDEQIRLEEEAHVRAEQEAISHATQLAQKALEERRVREAEETEARLKLEAELKEQKAALEAEQSREAEMNAQKEREEEMKRMTAEAEAAEKLRLEQELIQAEAAKREAELMARLKAENEAEDEKSHALEAQKSKRVPEQDHEAIMRTIEQMSRTMASTDRPTQADKFKDRPTLGDKVSRSKLNDIKKAIGINERFLYANELFGGDMTAFKQAVEELNHVDTEDDANRLLNEELAEKYHWNEEDETVIAFKSLVSRRFV